MAKRIKSFKPIAVLALLLFSSGLPAPGTVSASSLVAQTALDGSTLQPFVASLPVFGPGYNAVLPRVDAAEHPFLTVKMKEIEQQVLPGFPKTRVWAYEISDSRTGKVLGPANWPAVTVETRRYHPTRVKYVNELPSYGTGQVQGLVSVDKTIHWSDPLNSPMMNPCLDNPLDDCATPYTGPVPTVPHLHGAEVTSYFDGGPEAWFTPTGLKGPAYATLGRPGPGEAIYHYLNHQEPGTLWFHDHALGSTRTNVYSGLAAFYFLRDEDKEPKNLPKDAYEIEMAIQDRQFDTNGQLYFPDGSDPLCGTGLAGDPCLNGGPPNATTHPFWNPEFIGDVAVVNGAPWPVLKVEPRRYRFRLLDGSNARMYNLGFGDTSTGETQPPVYVIGSDESYLDSPRKVDKVFIAPGERYDVIVDFTNMAGRTVTLTNDAPIPYPSGLSPVPVTDPITGAVTPADQPQMAQIMQFQVSVAIKSADRSCNPAAGACKRPKRMARLADGAGSTVSGVKIDKVRQLVLKEHEGPGGPLEVLVNNTKWDGMMSPSIASIYASTNGISELPRQGSIELWEIINLTMDAHPMHTHLTQFQVVNREGISGDGDNGGGYFAAWGAAFGDPNNLPAACTAPANPLNPCPGYGPPLPYNQANADGALGGNPALSPYLLGNPTAPTPQESGWKDTVPSYPGQVLRILVRWTPTSVPQIAKKSYTGKNLYPFDPTKGPGYVWHCHIIDHEDNEMMRPYKVTK